MTVGTAPDSVSAETMAGEIDLHGRTVGGTIEALEVLDVGEGSARRVAVYPLEAGVGGQGGGAA